MPDVDPKKVFVVHGRNLAARDAMFAFLRAIGLDPIEWSTAISATGSGAPFIGQALDAAFAMAKAVVVLLTPDDVAYLRPEYASGDDDPETEPKGQARPNVLFEAGMALGHHPDRTIIVELGPLRPFSDVAGRHLIRMDSSAAKRNELASRLRNAGCEVNTANTDWLNAGDFTPPPAPNGPMGRRVPSTTPRRQRHLDGRYLSSGGSGRVQITNVGHEEVFKLRSPNRGEFHGWLGSVEFERLPVGKTVTLHATLASGAPDTFDLIVTGQTESGEDFSESLFLDLNN
ncbi:TIR domain-containing protein [Mycolicibacterium poriferae]|nr:nucleotide-binding protein [Mycolicibacterium poriferae]